MSHAVLVGMLALLGLLTVTCSSSAQEDKQTLDFDVETGDFFFEDSTGNRVFYDRAENTLIVEPDIDVDQLARAFCRAERETANPARFAAVSLVLADAVIPFIETVERLCDR